MLSGIGDSSHLKSKGIKTLVNLPAVGTNLQVPFLLSFEVRYVGNPGTQDHVFLGNSWNVSANFTLDDLHRNATFTAEQLQLWMTNGSGLLGLPPTNQFMWLRTNESTFSALGVKDPSAGPTSAHFELIISVCAVLDMWDYTVADDFI